MHAVSMQNTLITVTGALNQGKTCPEDVQTAARPGTILNPCVFFEVKRLRMVNVRFGSASTVFSLELSYLLTTKSE